MPSRLAILGVFVLGAAVGATAITVLPSLFDATTKLACTVTGADSNHLPVHYTIVFTDKEHPALVNNSKYGINPFEATFELYERDGLGNNKYISISRLNGGIDTFSSDGYREHGMCRHVRTNLF